MLLDTRPNACWHAEEHAQHYERSRWRADMSGLPDLPLFAFGLRLAYRDERASRQDAAFRAHAPSLSLCFFFMTAPFRCLLCRTSASTQLFRYFHLVTPKPSLAAQQLRLFTSSPSSGQIVPPHVAKAVLSARQELSASLAKLPERWARLEVRAAALVNGIALSTTGQKLVATVLPMTLAAALWPSHNPAYALSPDIHHPGSLLSAKHQPRTPLQRLLLRVPVPQVLMSLWEEAAILLRGCYLLALFLPALVTAHTALWLGGAARLHWMQLVTWTLEQAGPAFIKWGQWGATRPDLFPPDLTTQLERLQTAAPAHSAQHSRAVVGASLGRPVHVLFDMFEDKPVASGSIAQIHRARLSAVGAALARGGRLQAGTVVAVKVRHPGVAKVMQRDFVLMQRAVKLASALPGLAALRLEESVRQFGGPLQEQLDLGLEAAHLTRFRANFRLWPNVSFPNPIYPFVAKDVLVESFEDGALISTFVNQPDYKHRGMLAETGLTCYLQMLLRDNFIHADLHPGNILVKEVDTRSALGGGWAGWLSSALPMCFPPKLILLDTGMIAELSKPDQAGLITFFRALTKQDGAGLGQAILDMSERHTCKNPEAFVAALAAMFDALDPDYIHRHTSRVIESIIDTLRQHQVTLKSTVSTVVVTTLVLEGWSSKLNPDMRILDHMRDMLQADWGERIGRIVDKTMSSGSLAIA
ncbi:hypothetical protein QJQ45_017721 [Haematococcus lacustris]|nr:hypothetical protein QJQ45_017721 [Haematococcus lacustris]